MAKYEFIYRYVTEGVAVLEFDSDDAAEEWLEEVGEDELVHLGYDVGIVEVEYDVSIREQLKDGRTRSIWDDQGG